MQDKILGAVGILLIIISVYLIFWNEDIGLHGVKPVHLDSYDIISIPDSPADFKNNNQLIYTYGKMVSNDVLQDQQFGFSDKVIKLERKVEMYQWTQEEQTSKQKLPDGSEREVVTYTYKPVWSKDLIDSNGFRDAVAHQNPMNMPLSGLVGQAQNVTIGDFHLSPKLIAQITKTEPVDLSGLNLANLQAGTKSRVAHDGKNIFIGGNPNAPVVGDIRISLSEVVPQYVSVIAQQTDNQLHPLVVQGAQPIGMLVIGEVSPKEMIHQGKEENKNITWLIRAATLILALAGVYLVVKAMALGSMQKALLIGLGVWTVFMAGAWFIVKPMWAVALIIVVIAIYAAVFAATKKRQENQ